jgi:hypothetical protein
MQRTFDSRKKYFPSSKVAEFLPIHTRAQNIFADSYDSQIGFHAG